MRSRSAPRVLECPDRFEPKLLGLRARASMLALLGTPTLIGISPNFIVIFNLLIEHRGAGLKEVMDT